MRRISRLPSEAASRNISACSAQAISQVGWRLMVASSANTRRPLVPAACGDIARALATKAAISSEVEAFASGSDARSPAFSAEVASPDLSLVGSRDNQPRLLAASLIWMVFPESASARFRVIAFPDLGPL